ncbi:GNAT family N-acetyltransferase [Streptomyces virginiae]|uniref:GNAT family N-acetyltransferase n=1 Tax=Streptomyces virginiae TaxID=1961 RepID=UPI0036BB1E5E
MWWRRARPARPRRRRTGCVSDVPSCGASSSYRSSPHRPGPEAGRCGNHPIRRASSPHLPDRCGAGPLPCERERHGPELAGGPKAAGADRGCTYRWVVEGDRVHSGIALRHGLDDRVPRFGHIGYGIRPSSRRRGLATWALGRMLTEAWALGLDRVLMVCAVDNLASVRTIERHGGLLEGIRDTEHGPARRYWIEASGAS